MTIIRYVSNDNLYLEGGADDHVLGGENGFRVAKQCVTRSPSASLNFLRCGGDDDQ